MPDISQTNYISSKGGSSTVLGTHLPHQSQQLLEPPGIFLQPQVSCHLSQPPPDTADKRAATISSLLDKFSSEFFFVFILHFLMIIFTNALLGSKLARATSLSNCVVQAPRLHLKSYPVVTGLHFHKRGFLAYPKPPLHGTQALG